MSPETGRTAIPICSSSSSSSSSSSRYSRSSSKLSKELKTTKNFMLSQKWMLLVVFVCTTAATTIPCCHGGAAFVAVTPTTTRPYPPSVTTQKTIPMASTERSTVSLFMNKKGKSKSAAANKGFGSGAAAATDSSQTGGSKVMKIDRFPYSGTLRPGKQSPQKVVLEESIVKPDYWKTARPVGGGRPMLPWMIEVKSAQDIAHMRASGALAREILDLAGRAVAPGITTDEIDQIVHDAIIQRGAYPSPLNYHGFPKSCCTSVNEVICHGIPDDRPLQRGDIINLDITVYLNGFHGDCSEMFVVGGEEAIDPAGRNLLQTTYDCWIQACQFVEPGKDYKDIGAIIEDHVVPRGFSTVRNFCGHGIGQTFHTNPNILHYRNNEPNGQMAVGHTFTIEPMICEGSAKALTWPDEWTATTVDGKRSAQFEHTLLVTPDGVEALTAKNAQSPLQFWERDSTIHQGFWLGTSAAAKAKQDEINAQILAKKE